MNAVIIIIIIIALSLERNRDGPLLFLSLSPLINTQLEIMFDRKIFDRGSKNLRITRELRSKGRLAGESERVESGGGEKLELMPM